MPDGQPPRSCEDGVHSGKAKYRRQGPPAHRNECVGVDRPPWRFAPCSCRRCSTLDYRCTKSLNRGWKNWQRLATTALCIHLFRVDLQCIDNGASLSVSPQHFFFVHPIAVAFPSRMMRPLGWVTSRVLLTPLTEQQCKWGSYYLQTGQIPEMSTDGREPAMVGAGYLRYRKIFAGGDNVLISDAQPANDTRVASGENGSIDGLAADAPPLPIEATHAGRSAKPVHTPRIGVHAASCDRPASARVRGHSLTVSTLRQRHTLDCSHAPPGVVGRSLKHPHSPGRRPVGRVFFDPKDSVVAGRLRTPTRVAPSAFSESAPSAQRRCVARTRLTRPDNLAPHRCPECFVHADLSLEKAMLKEVASGNW